MIKSILSLALILIGISSCSNKDVRPSTSLDTGRAFIRASLNGEFENAEKLLLPDSQNVQLFQSYKAYYTKLSQQEKNNYRSASYEINKYTDVNDSTTIINYSNTYMNKPMEIKVARSGGVWAVDFKYTYSDNPAIN